MNQDLRVDYTAVRVLRLPLGFETIERKVLDGSGGEYVVLG